MSEPREKPIQAGSDQQSCSPTANGHCITCSDEARPAMVLSVDDRRGIAVVEMEDATAEIDITLVDGVIPGSTLLIHGGIALSLWL